MGSCVALCHACHKARNYLPMDNNGESSGINPGTEDTQESNPSTFPLILSSKGLRKFEINCASRGFHVYRDIIGMTLAVNIKIVEVEKDIVFTEKKGTIMYAAELST